MPGEHSKLQFSNIERIQKIPVGQNKSLFTESVQSYQASSLAHCICCKSKPELNDFVRYWGPNCAQKFVEIVTNDIERLYDFLQNKQTMLPPTSDELKSFKTAQLSLTCNTKFAQNDKKVKDHFTGKI